MTSKLEEAAKNYIDGEAERDREFWDSMMGKCPHCEHEGTSIFKAGAKWLLEEAQKRGVHNKHGEFLVSVQDLEELIGEE